MPYYQVHKRHETKLSADQEKLKQALLATGQEFTATWHNILFTDPNYFAAYVRLRGVPMNKRRLSRKVQELVLLAMDASCTRMYEYGTHVHIAGALAAGATKEEIMETMELTSVLGVHAISVGVPLLQEVLQEKGQSINTTSLSPQQEKLKESFKAQRGYWNSSWDAVLASDPEFFAAYTEFSSVPFKSGSHGHIDAKTRELIYVAIDAATTHLYQPGLKTHIRNAIDNGALVEEIMEVFELASLMGVTTVTKGIDVLAEEWDAHRRS